MTSNMLEHSCRYIISVHHSAKLPYIRIHFKLKIEHKMEHVIYQLGTIGKQGRIQDFS